MTYDPYVWTGNDASEPGVIKEIRLREAACSVCEATAPCLQIDNSGGEYAYVNVCEGCTAKAFQRVHAQAEPAPEGT